MSIKNVWVIADTPDKYPALLAGAKEIGGAINAIFSGSQAGIADLFAHGAEKVYYLGELGNKMFEDYAASIIPLINNSEKKAVVLMSATKRCKALAAKLTVAIKSSVCVNEGVTFVTHDDAVKISHMVYGGLAYGSEKVTADVIIMTAAGGTFDAKPANAGATGEVVNVNIVDAGSKIICKERKPKKASSVDLSAAKRVIGVGRGFIKAEDLNLAEELAKAIGAELGCSRPVAEGEKWMETSRYIGVSGAMLKPDFYLAIGISGQIQHMVGANSAQTIIAINKDKNAPIFKTTDYGIVGDLYKIVPALTKLLSK